MVRPFHVRGHDNVMVKVMTRDETKSMNSVAMIQGYATVKFLIYKRRLSMVTANLLTEKVAESVIPDPIRIQMLTKVLYNKTYIQIQFKFKFNSVLKRALENMNFILGHFWPLWIWIRIRIPFTLYTSLARNYFLRRYWTSLKFITGTPAIGHNDFETRKNMERVHSFKGWSITII